MLNSAKSFHITQPREGPSRAEPDAGAKDLLSFLTVSIEDMLVKIRDGASRANSKIYRHIFNLKTLIIEDTDFLFHFKRE